MSTRWSALRRWAERGARSSSSRNSRRARPAAHASRLRPLASITAMTAPARYSPTISVPAKASTAMASTPRRRWRAASMTHHTASANAAAVVAAHTASPAAANPARLKTPPALRPAMVAIRNSPSTWRLPVAGAGFPPSMSDLLPQPGRLGAYRPRPKVTADRPKVTTIWPGSTLGTPLRRQATLTPGGGLSTTARSCIAGTTLSSAPTAASRVGRPRRTLRQPANTTAAGSSLSGRRPTGSVSPGSANQRPLGGAGGHPSTRMSSTSGGGRSEEQGVSKGEDAAIAAGPSAKNALSAAVLG